jgi:hypothetical protein
MIVQFAPAGLLGHAVVREDMNRGFQSPFATDLFLYGEVPAVNKP